MKQLILFTLITIFCFSANAQGDMTANSLFKQYKRNTEMRGGTIPGFLVHMGSWFVDNEDEPELKYLMKKIGSIKFLAKEGESEKEQKIFLAEMANMLSTEYEELMTINDGSDNFVLRVKETKGNVKELVMLGQSDEEALYIVVHGNIPIEEIGTLVNGITESDFVD